MKCLSNSAQAKQRVYETKSMKPHETKTNKNKNIKNDYSVFVYTDQKW